MFDSLKHSFDEARRAVANAILPHDHFVKERMKGEVWFKMGDGPTVPTLYRNRPKFDPGMRFLGKNVITNDTSILVARLIKDPTEPSAGAFALAVGTGDTGWDLQNVPSASATQRSLYTELARKQFSSIDFINASTGLTSAIPTNVLDFTCTFATSEAVGALVEMGIVCAPVDTTSPLSATPVAEADWSSTTIDLRDYDTFLNVRNFNVINKPGTMTLTFVWRVTF